MTSGNIGEDQPCGIGYVVTDYDPFGYTNRTSFHGGTPHLYTSGPDFLFAGITQPPLTTGTRIRARARFSLVDTEAPYDYAYFKTSAGTVPDTTIGGYHAGPRTSPWMELGSNGVLEAWFPTDASTNYRGVQVEGFEYQRDQNDATPAWIPLASPGHYFDAETGFFENWNRYYYPRTGTYLTPEPMYASGEFVMAYANAGVQLNPYAYAANNPLKYVDRTGLDPINGFDPAKVPPGGPGQGHGPQDGAKWWHYNRNMFNVSVTYEFAQAHWIRMEPWQSIYHQHGSGNENNEKYISPNGACEAVFRPGGAPVEEPANLGTYNYAAPIGIWGSIGHFFSDVEPYWWWGNSPDDPTGAWGRVTGAPGPQSGFPWSRP